MTRRISLLFCALALLLSLSGCWSSDETEEEKDFWETPSPDETQEGADNSLTPITAFALPYLQNVTLDPITCPDGMQQTVGALLYEGLFALDESFTPQNVLCSRYEHNDDCTSFTFYLREDARLSDGSSLTASVVLATLRRAQEHYRALTDAQKQYVTRLEELRAAEEYYRTAEAEKPAQPQTPETEESSDQPAPPEPSEPQPNIDAVKAVSDLIRGIGEVTLERREAIEAALEE